MFLFPIPTLPRIPVFAKVLPSTAPFLAGHPTRPRRQRLARAPRTEEGPSTVSRLRPRPKQDPWKFLPLGHQWDLLSLPTFTSTWFAWLNRSNKWRNYHICRRASIRIHVRISKAAASKINLVQECCTPLCGNSAQVTCKAGFAVKEENVNKTSADIDEAATWCVARWPPNFFWYLLAPFFVSRVSSGLTLEGELSWWSNCFACASFVWPTHSG